METTDESRLPPRRRLAYHALLFDRGWLDDHIINYSYPGSGTAEDPFAIGWTLSDPKDPMQFSPTMRWIWTGLVSMANFAVALATSAYTASPAQVMETFAISDEVFELGLSAFILGTPLSCCSLVGCALTLTIEGLVIMRFLAGAFGSSPLAIAGGILADIWPDEERDLAMIFFSSAPLFGPALGPVVGGFLGQAAGWRWIQGFLAILGTVCCLSMAVVMPETFAPVLLKRRAEKLSQATGRVYVSKLKMDHKGKSLLATMKTAVVRPWVLLCYEPIVLVLTVYMAILYGTLYLFFAAFPIVYQEYRGLGQGIGGLAFLGLATGIGIGILTAICVTIYSNKAHHEKSFDPEIRLPMSLVGCVAIPIGLFWFAWTDSPSIHWLVSIAAQAPFGFGFVLVYISIQNYLVDAYTIYAASVLAANGMLRSVFGAAFPLFTAIMYRRLGIHWASCVPGFLALACVPFPFIFYRYGERIRRKCRFAAEAAGQAQQLKDRDPVEKIDGPGS
ncbi:Uu.00g095140.m01.CDS01 [Anthostomella pinea]|uniref:Uu.00g095140.m01.CDS01 n=1 Tax=Anthostomella pinea TaxID=933095 RepID=A0AAI8VTW4_9PEZI|nr:Uu.00g095140.m01.CDS01 [Anthostomella pinea]